VVRRLGLVAIAASLAACSGEILSDNLEGLNPQEQVARQKWVDLALPVFQAATCIMCHNGSMPNIGYLEGAGDFEKRDTLVAYMPAVVNLAAPMSSRILTKGAHTGPALEAKQASDVLEWIQAESLARPDVPPVRTAKMVLQPCTMGNPGDPACPINMIDLTPLGAAGTLEVVVTQLVSDTYLTNIKVKAGATGMYLQHPIFETWPPDNMDKPKPDPIDRWFNVVLNLAPNAESALGTGEGTYTGWKAADPISFRVDVIEAQRAGI